MEGSSEAYEQLVELAAQQLPDVAAEVLDEIRRGRSVSASRIDAEDRKLRQHQLSEQDLGRIVKSDVTVEPYGSDDGLVVFLEGLQTLAASMSATRRGLAQFGRQHGLQSPYVAFIDPDEAAPVRADTTNVSNR